MRERLGKCMARWCIAILALMSVAAMADPPARVGRLGYVDGQVSFFADRGEGWRKANANYPVTSENSLWVQGPGRGEVTIGSSAFRVGDDTLLDFVRVDEDGTQLYLQRGSLNLRVREAGAERDALAVDTAQGRFIVEAAGRYRLDTDGRDSRLSVFVGRMRFEGPDGQRLLVDAGRMLVVTGPADYRFEFAAEATLDRWAAARDLLWDPAHQRAIRTAVVSPYMTGYEDLDANGEWMDDAEYGRVWAPRVVVVGWEPYRYGHWAYVRPWGWTWIDDAAWGFAPFHYGRWVYLRARWWWWPGPYVVRPCYAPALVAWVGGARAIGPQHRWVPLAPREHFVPHYTHSAAYWQRINHLPRYVGTAPPQTRWANDARTGARHTVPANPSAPNATPPQMGSRVVGSTYTQRPPANTAIVHGGTTPPAPPTPTTPRETVKRPLPPVAAVVRPAPVAGAATPSAVVPSPPVRVAPPRTDPAPHADRHAPQQAGTPKTPPARGDGQARVHAEDHKRGPQHAG